jgi:hypothetical protein
MSWTTEPATRYRACSGRCPDSCRCRLVADVSAVLLRSCSRVFCSVLAPPQSRHYRRSPTRRTRDGLSQRVQDRTPEARVASIGGRCVSTRQQAEELRAMRYAESPGAQADVLVKAPQEVVWNLVVDVEKQVAWSRELQRVTWVDRGSGPAVGASFLGYNRNDLLGEWRTLSRIVESERGRVLSWVVVDVDERFCLPATSCVEPMATWRYDLEPAVGGVFLRQSVRIGPGRSGLSLAIDRMPEREEELVAYRVEQLRRSIQATLDAMKASAEQGAADK